MLSVKKTNIIQTLFLFASAFLILFFSPYSADDYSLLSALVKGEDIGLKEFLLSAVYFGNGRFLGNLELWMSVYTDVFRIVVKPVFLTAIIIMTVYLFELKKDFQRVLVALFLLFPSTGFVSRCYVNTPCFFNFVAPLVGFLLSLCILKWYRSEKKNVVSKILACVVLSVASVCMQLHSEHSTLIFVLSAIGICVFEKCKYKKVSITAALFTFGSLIGALLMFVAPKMMGVASNMDVYRGFHLDIPYAIGVLGKFAEMISSVVFLFALMSILELVVVIKESPKDKFRSVHILIAAVYPVISLVYTLNMQTNEAKAISYVKLLFLAMLILYLLNTVAIIIRFVKTTESKSIMLYIILMAVLSVGVFVVLNQHGYRTFYLALFLMLAFAIVLFKAVIREYNIVLNADVQKITGMVLKTAFVVLVGIMSFQMVQNYDVYIMRDHYVSEKSNTQAEVIEIPKLPNKRIWMDEYLHLYRSYFDIAGNGKEIKFVDIEDWELYEEYQAMQDNPFEAITYAVSNFNFNKGIRK